ncbi:MAG: DUF4886 domain-containing protein [Alphaproteobacteria bacterium]
MLCPLSACKNESKNIEKTVTKQEKPIVRIAFVGNEISAPQYLPAMIKALANSDPSAHFNVQADILSANGQSLAELWQNEKRKTFLTKEKWDYVVLQPHELWASNEAHVYLTQKSLAAWSQIIRSIGAQPVFFMPWPLPPGHEKYGEPQYATQLKNYKYMHHMNNGYAKALSQRNNMILIPVGSYWTFTMNNAPGLTLYQEKSTVPSLEGTFLTALVLYKKLVDSSLDDLEYIPSGMEEEARKVLIAIASKDLEK